VTINVGATIATVALGYLIYRVRISAVTGRHSLPEIQQAAAAAVRVNTYGDTDGTAPPERRALARQLATDFLADEYLRYTIIGGDMGAGRASFMTILNEELTACGILCIPLRANELAGGQSLVEAARHCLVARIRTFGSELADADRLWRFLLARNRLVVLVSGLELLDSAMSGSRRRTLIESWLSEQREAGVPFFAALPTELFPDSMAINKVMLDIVEPEELATQVEHDLAAIGLGPDSLGDQRLPLVFMGSQASRDPTKLALAMLLVRIRLQQGLSCSSVFDTFADSRRLRRESSWIEGIIGIDSPSADPTDSPTATSPEAECLALLGAESLIRLSGTARWSDIELGLPEQRRRRLLLGRSTLERHGILAVHQNYGDDVIIFRDPWVRAFACGLGVPLSDEALWLTALRSGPSPFLLDALAVAAMFTRSTVPHDDVAAFLRSTFDLLVVGRLSDRLTVLTALYDGLVAYGRADLLDATMAKLVDDNWQDAGQEDRIRVIRTVDLDESPELRKLLWRHVTPPKFGENSFRVRREICLRLSDGGNPVWETLREVWHQLYAAGLAGDLSTTTRGDLEGQHLSSGLASLAWILPLLVTRCSGAPAREAQRLLARMARAAMPPYHGYRRADVDVPDIGLEISLAEGMKIAAVDAWLRHDTVPESAVQLMSRVLSGARSWLSRIAVIQALGLSLGRAEPGRLKEIVTPIVEDARQHPFAREAARLVGFAVQSGSFSRQYLLRAVWLNEQDALASRGSALSAEAHRLLAASTLLVNMCEWRAGHLWTGRRDDIRVDQAGQAVRVDVLTARHLPPCLSRASWGRSMADKSCRCDYGLCGRIDSGLNGPRHFDSSFLHRAAMSFSGIRFSPFERLRDVAIPGRLCPGTKRVWTEMWQATIDSEGDRREQFFLNERA
jgi:hypothetical protein